MFFYCSFYLTVCQILVICNLYFFDIFFFFLLIINAVILSVYGSFVFCNWVLETRIEIGVCQEITLS